MEYCLQACNVPSRQTFWSEIVPLKRGWQRRENDLVFPSEVGTPRRAANVWLSFQRLLRRAGLQPMKFHNLPHTAASLALQANVPIEISRRPFANS